jgi:hypothetical protein
MLTCGNTLSRCFNDSTFDLTDILGSLLSAERVGTVMSPAVVSGYSELHAHPAGCHSGAPPPRTDRGEVIMQEGTTFAALAAAGLAGALALGGCATLEEAVAGAVSQTYHANLTGAQEVGGGDPDGSGKARITIEDNFNQVCWRISDVRNISPITAAHIHVGVVGTNGPPVFTLTKSNEGTWVGCSGASEWTQDRIEGNPERFYVNLHTADYPDGAIRGQLRR